MKNNSTRFAFALAFLLSGCSAAGPRFAGLTEPPSNKSDVYIYRSGKFLGIGKPYEIIVDGQKAASLKNAGYVKLSIAPGRHSIIAQPEMLQALSPESARAETTLMAEPAKRYFLVFSINSSVSGDTYYIRRNTLREVSERSAIQDLAELNYSE